MSMLSKLFRRHQSDPSPSVDEEPRSPLGLADWEGADRWPEDDEPASDAQPEVDLTINMDPNRPSSPL